MKIGIVTLPLETNYGGILQNYALQKVLLRMGHDVYTVDWHNIRCYRGFKHNLFGWMNRLVQRVLKKKVVSIMWNPFITSSQLSYLTQNITPFINEYISLTRRISARDFASIDSEYKFEGYVVGSDQVWVNSYSLHSFLNFVSRTNVVKVVYAASSNDNSWITDPFLVTRCKDLAKSFNGLSARESSLASSAQSVLGRKIETVLDPTLLLSKEEYVQLIRKEPTKANNRCLFSYILDSSIEKSDIINSICGKYGYLEITNMPKRKFVKERYMDLDEYVFPSVEDWLKCFETSSFVVTDSFHGTVFSIIFNKPFIVIANKERGIERLTSLLKQFGLDMRLVYENEPISKIIKLLDEPIDYKLVNEKILYLRKTSIQFLKNSLKY